METENSQCPADDSSFQLVVRGLSDPEYSDDNDVKISLEKNHARWYRNGLSLQESLILLEERAKWGDSQAEAGRNFVRHMAGKNGCRECKNKYSGMLNEKAREIAEEFGKRPKGIESLEEYRSHAHEVLLGAIDKNYTLDEILK